MSKIKKIIIGLLLIPSLVFAYEPKAKQIQNTPAGDVSSTNVQDAINELDTEKYKSGDSPTFITIYGTTLDLGTNILIDVQLGRILLDFIRLSPFSAKITGSYITQGAAIDAGDPEWKLLFDDTTEEQALWHFTMPQTYLSGLQARIIYSMAGANTSKKIDLEVSVMAVADGENIITTSFDTLNEVSGGTTVPATADLTDTIVIPLTNVDSVARGEECFIKINRDTDDTDDNAVGDVQIHDILIEWSR